MSGAASTMFPFLPPSLLGSAGAPGAALHPLLGVPVLRTPADLLAQQYLWALAATAAETPATSVSSSVSGNDHSANRSVFSSLLTRTLYTALFHYTMVARNTLK